jgi:hypothetical protein
MGVTDQIAWRCCTSTTREAYGNHSREASGASVVRRDRNVPWLPRSNERNSLQVVVDLSKFCKTYKQALNASSNSTVHRRK